MANPYEISRQFNELKPDLELLKKLQKRHPQAYLRKRLKAIELLWAGKSRQEVIRCLNIDYKSLQKWIKVLVEHGVSGGLKKLARPIKRSRKGHLTEAQQLALIAILEKESPTDYGYEQHIFTGQILTELVKMKWEISVSDQTIYNILHRHKFSYQRAHRDYENADPQEQAEYAEKLKEIVENKATDEKQVSFDEFSVTNRPTTFYGWARVNTKFKVPSNEKKKRQRLNGLLAVDLATGKEYLQLSPQAYAIDIGDYFYDLACAAQREGYHQLTVVIDNNSTHKDKMRYHLWLKMKANPASPLQDFNVNFVNTPRYSPDFNLAEYIIHQLRLQLLHHLPANVTLDDIKEKLVAFLKDHQLQTSQQIRNTLNHILKLGKVTSGI